MSIGLICDWVGVSEFACMHRENEKKNVIERNTCLKENRVFNLDGPSAECHDVLNNERFQKR